MITEKVYSTVLDEKIHEHLNDSPIWEKGNCFHETEIADVKQPLYCYHIKFDGLKPIQVTKLTKPKVFKNDKKGAKNTGRYKK